MSTKIYNGYYLEYKGNTPTLEEAFYYLKENRSVFLDALFQSKLRFVSDVCIDNIDKDLLLKSGNGGNLIRCASFDYDQLASQTRRERTSWPDFDTEVSWVLIPHIKKLLCMLYAENRNVQKAWKDLDWVHNYAYWDNTDAPEDITDEEWEERSKVWDEAIGYDAPSTKGLSLELLSPYSSIRVPTAKEVSEYIKRPDITGDLLLSAKIAYKTSL